MPYSYDDWLPSMEELTVPELEVTSSVYRAAAFHLGKYCDNASKEFMLCFAETDDPRKCLNEGKEVTRCGFEFFKKVKASCYEEFNKYFDCIDHAGDSMHLSWCRPTQEIFDNCIKEKLGQDRPHVGYFTRVRLHKTDRPRPQLPEMPDLPEPLPPPPDYKNAPEPKWGEQRFVSG